MPRRPKPQPVPVTQSYEIALYNPQGNIPPSERKTAATELMTCKTPEVVIKGPAGTGKSLALMHRLNAVLQVYPGARGLLVRKTRSALNESALVIFENDVVVDGSPSYPDVRNTTRDNRRTYRYPNGSELVIGGMDTPERVMSAQYDIIAVPEATELTEHDWELLLTRLRNGVIPGYQQIIADMNPIYPNHWLNRRISEGKTKMLFSRHEDNPRLWDGLAWTKQGQMYLDKLKTLSGVRFLRLFKGVDAAAEGVVHPDFNVGRHVILPDDPQYRRVAAGVRGDWRKVRVVDFGYRHPFVCGWLALDPDGVMYRYREIFYSQRLVEDHAKDILAYSYDEACEVTLADHDAEDRATLQKHGIRTQPAFKSIKLGIEAVNLRLRDDRFFILGEGEVDGRKFGRVECDPILAEQGRPTKTSDEFDVYSYPEAKAGQAGKEDPVKEFDDGCDTNRYGICYIDDVARRRFKLRGGRVGKMQAA